MRRFIFFSIIFFLHSFSVLNCHCHYDGCLHFHHHHWLSWLHSLPFIFLNFIVVVVHQCSDIWFSRRVNKWISVEWREEKKSLWPTERVGLIDSTDVMDCDVFVVAWHRATMVITKEDNFLYVECALVPWMQQQQLNNDQKDGKNRMLLSNAT